MTEKELQKRLGNYLSELAQDEEVSLEEAREIVKNGWGGTGLRGYGIFYSVDVECTHVERIDEMEIYENDLEATKMAERDGIKIIYDLYFDEEKFPELAAYNGTIIDTLENREIIKKANAKVKKNLTITFGYEMRIDEVEEYLRENELYWGDFENEDEAYAEAACSKFNWGLGCDAEVR